MKKRSPQVLGILSAMMFASSGATAHESSGRSGHKEMEHLAVESDFYAGGHGYLHAGVGLLTPLGEANKGALTFHIVRERSGGSWFPSLGAELGHTFSNGVEVEGFSFGYFPVENRHAWALGARLIKPFEPAEGWMLAPFIGPTFARVRAENEASGLPADVSHTMLLGGLMISREPFEVRLFGSRSWFSRGVEGLETPVDLEEMTHLASYENNDGFARWSSGVEAEWEITSRLSLSVRYAAIFYPGESVRHSIGLLPGWQVNESVKLSAGVQVQQGAGAHRALFVSALGWEF